MKFDFPVTQLDMDQVNNCTPENLSVIKLIRIKGSIAGRVQILENDNREMSEDGFAFHWQRLNLLRSQVDRLQVEIDSRNPGHQLLHKR